jgi:hypothetical protein
MIFRKLSDKKMYVYNMKRIVCYAVSLLCLAITSTENLSAQNENDPSAEKTIKRARKERERPERTLIVKKTSSVPYDKKKRVAGNWWNHLDPFDETGNKGSSENNPIIINSAEQLAYLAVQVSKGNNYAGVYFRLTADIDLGMHEWMPIGGFGADYQDLTARFCGLFYGDGHKVKNLTIMRGIEYLGLFGVCGAGSYVEKLNIIDCFVKGRMAVGGLVGEIIEGTVSECSVTGDIIATNEYVGGLTGINNGTVTNCHASVMVFGGSNDVGGLVGVNGDRMMGVVTNCYTAGTVNGYCNVGGLAGRNNSIISNCYATGDVSGEEWIGGLVGWADNGMVTNSHAKGTVKGYFDVGGLIGFNGYQRSSVTVNNCYATGAVVGNGIGNYCIGGLAGYSGGTILNSYATGEVSGDESVGGLIGEQGGKVIGSYATSDVNGSFDVGGLIGFNGYPGSPTVVENCHSSGSVTGYRVFNYSIGGLAGYSGGTISKCYAEGSVTGEETVGGLVGEQGGVLTDSYATGSVSAKISAGGLVGWNWAKMQYCYAAGSVHSQGGVGGLIGANQDEEAVIAHCYFDRQTTGQESGIGKDNNAQNDNVIAQTTEELKRNALPDGFDKKVWTSSEGSYPKLKNFEN